MTERACPVCGTNHNDLCARMADAVHARAGGDFLWAVRKAKPLTTLHTCPECGKRSHWGTCKEPRARYFPGDPGYGLTEVEREKRIAAKLPMYASEIVDTKPVHKLSTTVHKTQSVDTEAVHKSTSVDSGPVLTAEGDDTAARRAAYKREWMAKKRGSKSE